MQTERRLPVLGVMLAVKKHVENENMADGLLGLLTSKTRLFFILEKCRLDPTIKKSFMSCIIEFSRSQDPILVVLGFFQEKKETNNPLYQLLMDFLDLTGGRIDLWDNHHIQHHRNCRGKGRIELHRLHEDAVHLTIHSDTSAIPAIQNMLCVAFQIG
jgi:hypothetical protein